MNKRDLEARRQRNRELGERDRANRCGFCKRALAGCSISGVDGRVKFCSTDYLDDHLAREASHAV